MTGMTEEGEKKGTAGTKMKNRKRKKARTPVFD
jgi:hypothetical protein